MKQKILISQDASGHKIVVLPGIIFKNKQKIDWYAVEKYLHRYVGKIATEKRFSKNRKEKYSQNAGNGWYYYTTRFAMPIYENETKTDNYYLYSACLLINHSDNGKLYLYDLVDIKREACTPLTINKLTPW